MAAAVECVMCERTANETDEGQLFRCPISNCPRNNQLLCTKCGIQSHSNHRRYNHEFGGKTRMNLQIQTDYEKAIIAKITSTSKMNHGVKKFVGNSGYAIYSVIEAGKAALKQSGKKYTTKQLFEAGTKELTKKGVVKGLAKGAVILQAGFCAYECAVELNRFRNGIISAKECQRLITRSITANSMTLGGAAGGACIGFAMGGPGGAIVGGVIGGIAADAGTRFVFDRWVWSNEEQKERENDMKEALLTFQYIGIGIDDIWTDDTFNRRGVNIRYHNLALDNHPDRPNGSKKKFETVLRCYNILLGILNEKERRN